MRLKSLKNITIIVKIEILLLEKFCTERNLCIFQKTDFTHFSHIDFLDICVLLGLFFTVKNIVEFIFNWIIDTQETFKAFFLQNLFAELLLSIILLVFLLIYIYNNHISRDFMLFLILFSFGGYAFFNIVRSYQLMGNIRIPYKLHFFLYICAFKIIPMLLLARYILNNIVQ